MLVVAAGPPCYNHFIKSAERRYKEDEYDNKKRDDYLCNETKQELL